MLLASYFVIVTVYSVSGGGGFVASALVSYSIYPKFITLLKFSRCTKSYFTKRPWLTHP